MFSIFYFFFLDKIVVKKEKNVSLEILDSAKLLCMYVYGNYPMHIFFRVFGCTPMVGRT